MLTLKWAESALDDLDRIVEFIADFNYDAALRMQATIEACAERLADHPYTYRPGRISETREALVHPNYLPVYRVGADTVEIVSVLHSRQQYPGQQSD